MAGRISLSKRRSVDRVADATTTRFNVGIRTLDQGATIAITLHDDSGGVVNSVTKVFAPNYFVQTSLNDLVGYRIERAVTIEDP